jgi:peptidase E
MKTKKGMIALMGSGELTATMVEVHKEILDGLGENPRAVFLDTPAGFQLNCDQLSGRAIDYFLTHVQRPLTVASYKSHENTTEYDAERAFQTLRRADYVLIGPGSPTYAVRQWLQSPIARILWERIENGGCLVAASAAALTVGRLTIPVYEIYKVGEELHWAHGMDILSHFGFHLVVVPHWNNAEGGTHDTRFCYMGEPRFRGLESLLPEDVGVLGLDEHTACLIDLERDEGEIRGIGRITVRRGDEELTLEKGDRFPLAVLRGASLPRSRKVTDREVSGQQPGAEKRHESFWDGVHRIERAFRDGLDALDGTASTNAVLELDRAIWRAKEDLENEEFISQARDLLREMIVLLGTRLSVKPRIEARRFAPLVEKLLELRERMRREERWQEADAIRESLGHADVIIEDEMGGSRWRLKS